MKKLVWLGLSGLTAGLLGSCAEASTGDDVESTEQALATDLHYYLRCNSTGWGADANSRMLPVSGSSQLRAIDMKVTQSYMTQSGDQCIVTATNQQDGWGTQQKTFGITSTPWVVPGSRTLALSTANFAVKFPALGTFRAQLDVVSGNLTIMQPKLYRGIGVIADFADRKLEQFTGDGIQSPADLRAQLDQMQAHWAWLSRGREQYQWDIVRVTLPVNLTPTAYAGWWEYRDAVVSEVKKVAPLATYDGDHDGDYDALWVIVSNSGEYYDYQMGGASWNNGAHVFVDEQGSLSIQVSATGNFNHELGHLRGLPDVYGPYSTIHQLSIMADSWAVPPNDFSAFDRTKLGWASVTNVTRSTTGIVLPSANEQMSVVRIPTSREQEYFLIENRVRPASGYASTGDPYSGLVVWHVLENSDQWQNPPLLAVVPADGVISPNENFNPQDLLYPGNPVMRNPFVARSYFGNQEVFRIRNLTSTTAGLKFDVTLSTQTSTNLLANGGAEAGSTAPTAWTTGGWKPWEGVFTWASGVAHSGSRSLMLSAPTSNDIQWEQTLSNLVAGQSYSYCGWVKGENLSSAGGDIGANLSVYWVDANGNGQANAQGGGLGTYDWKKICVVFSAPQSTMTFQCRIGHWGQDLTGTGYCDDLTLEGIYPAF
jgi:M6 family metalloprotease-like protein